MKNKVLPGNRRKLLFPLAIATLIVLSIVIVLANNKKKINKTMEPVDRTKIPVSVTVEKVAYKPLNIDVRYPATTQPYEEAMLYAQTSGLITRLNIALGQQVTKGQVLGQLDTKILQSNLEAAGISYRSAISNRQKLLDDYNRAKDLYENKAGLEVNMLTAKNNYDNAVNNEDNARVQVQLIKKQISNTNIIAPISGTISLHKVKAGEFTSPSSPIAAISNISKVKATVFVSQELSYQLKPNQDAIISSPLFGNEIFKGKIIFINAVADANHNYQVDLLISDNPGTKLKGGTDVQVSFNTLSQKEVLQIPKSALNTDARQPYVYVAENNKASRKNITVGIVRDDAVEVLSGLAAGEQVITSGQINLTNGSYISIKQ